MFASVVIRGSLGKLHKFLLVGLTLIVLFVSLPLDRAYAWSYAPVSGRRGSVSLPTIYIGDLYMPYGMTQFTLYGNTGPLAYRSPASSGTQIVKGKYLVEKWDGNRWVVSAQSTLFQGQILSTQTSLRFPAPYIQPVLARGTFRFTFALDWYTTGGALLGSTFIRSNLVSDHVCVTPHRLCKSYAGYFRTGGYQTGAW